MALRKVLLFAAICVAAASLRSSHALGLRGAKDLPPVPTLLNASAHTLGKISTKVQQIHAHVSGLEDSQRSELKQQKAEYEAQLTQEAQVNAKLAKANERTSTEIWDLEKANTALRKRAGDLQVSNLALRKALNTVQDKIDGAQEFVNASMVATNDEGAQDLDVLNQKHHEAEDDADADTVSVDKGTKKDEATEDDEDDDKDDDDQAAGNTSLIALSSKVRRMHRSRQDTDDTSDDDQDATQSAEETDSEDSTPGNQTDTPLVAAVDDASREMMESLQQELAQFAQEDKKSRAELTRQFQERFKKSRAEKASILNKQDVLKSTRTSLVQMKTQLSTAVHHLEGTESKLKKRLHELGEYLGRLSSFVLKPVAEAEKALPTLPDSVSAFVQA